MRSSKVVTDILAYLIAHPKAEDTIEGIVEWWMLKQNVERRVIAVKVALTRLVSDGFVLERKRVDGRVYYQLSQRIREEIRKRVENQSHHHNIATVMMLLSMVGTNEAFIRNHSWW